jgi:DNA-binding transcriptional regulator YhcF (GntR family)
LTPVTARSRAGSPHSPTERAQRRDRVAQSIERNIHISLAGRLGREIVGGIYPPGALLPNAADTCARFSVSRTALREAYSVLTAKAMIVARPKIGTRVRPKTDWNMLDPEVLSWHLQSTPTENFVAELFVARSSALAGVTCRARRWPSVSTAKCVKADALVVISTTRAWMCYRPPRIADQPQTHTPSLHLDRGVGTG